MKAEVISIGTELLLGEITDLNAAYLASQLPLLGLDLHFISTVGDNKQRLIETLNHACQRSDIIITTGGLGPTEDDITREAIADLCSETISIDQSLVTQFKQLFRQFNMDMPESNIKQASVIPSCQVIPNPRGTAPGWWVERDGRVIISMPGPPGEMQPMWTNVVAPRIHEKYCDSVIYSSTLKTFGLSEAKLGEVTRSYLLAKNPTVGIYAKPDGIHLRVAAKAPTLENARELVDKTTGELRGLAGDYIWGSDNDTLESLVSRLFIDKKSSLATMEINTGGSLANMLTNLPDSYKFFSCGIVLNRNEVKADFGINENVIKEYGAVSTQAAKEAASAVRRRLNTSVGVGLIAVLEADNSGMKPGTIIIGIDDGNRNHAFNRITPGNRMQIKHRAAISALFELRKIML
jgi:nicotinamide-nucleotide amidase